MLAVGFRLGKMSISTTGLEFLCVCMGASVCARFACVFL